MVETQAHDRRVLLLGAALLVALAALWLGVSAVRGAGSPVPPAAPITSYGVGGGDFFVSNGGARVHGDDGDCPFKDRQQQARPGEAAPDARSVAL